MFTAAFWTAALERAVKSFAQSLLAILGVAQVGILDVDWKSALSAAALAAVLSVVTSVASSKVGGPGPSLGAETVVPAAPGHRAEDGQISVQTIVVALLAVVVVILLFALTPLNWGRG